MTLRAELIRLMREEFDPTPKGWEGRGWNDNAEEVADKMLALITAPASAAEPVDEATANANRYRADENGIRTEAKWLVDQIDWKSPNPEVMKVLIGTHLSAKLASKPLTIDT